ncbi:Uncharacterized protein BM_BM9867 [Brugia malayi]|uniref:Bm9867 n=1 Tax=Brugia malayi TaxID=6279 RepID=A0A0I9N597_BRUMA|nr:Uncharacterized protein BM_BM9867 [Brugia malayi]CTP81239.1 Bm9867 [Brugia malayi]VIO91121.1 Uncharacterized protein BM_BM9867 [Brugia malayi]
MGHLGIQPGMKCCRSQLPQGSEPNRIESSRIPSTATTHRLTKCIDILYTCMVQVQGECIALVPRALDDANCLSPICHTLCICARIGEEARKEGEVLPFAHMPSAAPYSNDRGSGCSAQRIVPAFNLEISAVGRCMRVLCLCGNH